MMEDNKKQFVLNRLYPNIKTILQGKKSIDKIINDAIFVLDTNSLLVPYQTGKNDIEQIRKIYSKLISENRLYIPEHALKEFAKNRSIKISELFSNIDISLSSIPSIRSFEYPILGDLEAYKALNDSREDVSKAIKKYKECLKNLQDGIAKWNWSDPVTIMYSNTFPETIIFSTALTEEELLKEYLTRLDFDIPPGNKDKSKESNAIGDFLIWKSILELGKTTNKDIVFISNDEKNDWILKGNNKSISTKYELVHEFFEGTNGRNFISLNFSEFLKIQGIDIIIGDNFNLLLEDTISFAPQIGSIDNLNIIFKLISDFISQHEASNFCPFINDEINEPIKRFNATYKKEYYETSVWERYHPYFFTFSNILLKIMSLNNGIIYDEIRMKRETETDQIQLVALAKEFINKYKEFMMF